MEQANYKMMLLESLPRKNKKLADKQHSTAKGVVNFEQEVGGACTPMWHSSKIKSRKLHLRFIRETLY